MKKILIALAAIAIGSQVAEAQLTNQVLSRNAVGYIKTTLQTNKLYLLRNDFVGLQAPLAISNAIGNQLPINSQVLLYNEANQTYKAAIIYTAFGWGTGGTNRLPRGEAFFVRMPAAAASNQYQLFLMGEVPDTITAPTTTFNTVTGLNMDGYPYPTEARWTNTQYSKSLAINAQILTWNVTNQNYNAAVIKTAFGWGASGNALIIPPGQGFFIRSTNAVSFGEAKPYTWP